MTYKKYINGVGVRFSGQPTNNNRKKISKFGRQYPEPPTPPAPSFRGRVTARQVPTTYQRASILAKSQSFSDEAHSGLIRID